MCFILKGGRKLGGCERIEGERPEKESWRRVVEGRGREKHGESVKYIDKKQMKCFEICLLSRLRIQSGLF